MSKKNVRISVEAIASKIYLIRGQRVMLDYDLAEIYGVSTRQLIQALKRNLERFPDDFMFCLSYQEVRDLRSQIVISSLQHAEITAKLAENINEAGIEIRHGGGRYLPYAFTEQGVSMLSAVLKSSRAVAASIEIIRTFVRLRQLLASNLELSRRLDELEKKHDQKFSIVFDAIRQLMNPPQPTLPKKERIGF